jgi:serine/threonine protein kinase
VSDRLRGALEAALASRYTIERELGRGGMATVYLVQDLRHERPVALTSSSGSRIRRSIGSNRCWRSRTFSRPGGSGSIRASIRLRKHPRFRKLVEPLSP